MRGSLSKVSFWSAALKIAQTEISKKISYRPEEISFSLIMLPISTQLIFVDPVDSKLYNADTFDRVQRTRWPFTNGPLAMMRHLGGAGIDRPVGSGGYFSTAVPEIEF